MSPRTFVDPEKSNPRGAARRVPGHGDVSERPQSEAAADATTYDGVRPETIVILTEP